MIGQTTSLLLGALALGGAALAIAGEASARPGHGAHERFFDRHHGHHHIWRGYYGPHVVPFGGGYRCRFVRRVNAHGELVVRRICFNRL